MTKTAQKELTLWRSPRSKAVANRMDTASVDAEAVKARQKSAMRRCWRNWQGVAGISILAAFVLVAIFAPQLAPMDPTEIHLSHTLAPSVWSNTEAGFGLLGTDALGRDVLSRIIYGSRVSLLVGATATAIGLIVGVPLGLLVGYKGRPVDDVVTRLADVQSAIPFLVLLIAVLTFIGGGLLSVVFFLGMSGWIGPMRLVRGETLGARTRDYVIAARAIGATDRRIMVRHILPNVRAPVIIAASLAFGATILTESALSFLGLGVSASVPTWGRMLAESRQDILVSFGPSLFPGVAIVLVVLAANWAGDWLRDRLDPRLIGT